MGLPRNGKGSMGMRTLDTMLFGRRGDRDGQAGPAGAVLKTNIAPHRLDRILRGLPQGMAEILACDGQAIAVLDNARPASPPLTR